MASQRNPKPNLHVSAPHRQSGRVQVHHSAPVVTFQVTVKGMHANERLYLVGGGEELGNWEEIRAKPLSSSDGHRWSVSLALRAETKIHYKYIRIHETADGQTYVKWEDGPEAKNREFVYHSGSNFRDDGEIGSFGNPLPLKQSYYPNDNHQEILADHSSEEKGSFSSWWEESAKKSWVKKKFAEMTSAIHSDVHEKFCLLSKQVSELQTGQVNHKRLLAKLDLDRAPKAKGVGQSESLVQRFQILEESLPALRKQQNLEEEVRNLQETLSSHQAKYLHFEETLASHKSQIQDRLLGLDTKLDAMSKRVGTESLHLEIEKYLRGCSLSCKLRGLESEMMSSKQNTSKTLADIAAKSQELEHEIADLQQKMSETAALLPAYSEKLEKLEIGQKSLRRGIAELDCKIPSLHEDIPAHDVTMEGFQSSPDKLEELASEGGSLPEMLERIEERMEDGRLSERSSAKSEGLSPVSPPACRVEASGEGYVASDGRGERSAGEIKEFKYPKKPENDAMRKICLSVEEELLQAMKREEPLEVRKKLLKDVCRRLHPDKFDKTGRSSEGMLWLESWKKKHLEVYYWPYEVPDVSRQSKNSC